MYRDGKWNFTIGGLLSLLVLIAVFVYWLIKGGNPELIMIGALALANLIG